MGFRLVGGPGPSLPYPPGNVPKPLGEKSRVIRQAIKAHPDMGNAELAVLLAGQHSELDIDFKPGDIAAQRQALKKLAENGDEDGDGDEGWGPDEAPPAAPQVARATERPATPAPAADPTAVVDRV